MRPSVWAPDAGQVDLVTDGGTEPLGLDPDRRGWWIAAAELPAGATYRFSLDGGRPLVDPRSHHQPEGVHGPSAVVDHDGFAWGGEERPGMALDGSVLYEMHVGTFTPEGTFDAAAERLGHLVALGVTAVEVMPVAAFPGRHGWGYDGVDLYAVHEPYGGPDGFKRFVRAAHRHGLSVVLDVVYNHLGPDGNVLGAYGPYFTDTYRTPWGDAVNLDGPHSDEVRSFIVDNALHWIDRYHVDGLRLDAVHALFDRRALDVLEELAVAVGGRAVLIAESDRNDPRLVVPRDRGGLGLDGVWSDDLHHALHVAVTGEQSGYYEDYTGVADVPPALSDSYVFAGRWSEHRRRTHGRPVPADVPGWRFVTSLQNHDQVGNRAAGERVHHIAGVDRTLAAAALALLGPSTPMLFQGEEWAASTPFPYFTDHQDPELARAVTEGRRREFAAFGWAPEDVLDPQAPETFRAAVLDWEEHHRDDHARTLDWYRSVLAVRRDHPCRRPDVRVDADPASGTVRMVWPGAAVVANLGREAVTVSVRGSVHLRSAAGVEGGDGSVGLPPGSAAVLLDGGA